MEQNANMRNQKIGKKISTIELIKFIESNKNEIKNIKFIDLNNSINNKEDEKILFLEKANFQEIIVINFLPYNLSNIFLNKQYLHAGCLKTIVYKDNKNYQVSFFTSIISCLKQSFLTSSSLDQKIFISHLIDRMSNESIGIKFSEFNYRNKYKWKRTYIQQEFSNNNFKPNIIKYTSDYFHINIFILDIEKDLLFFGGDEYIPFKKTIFLIKYPDNIFEPLFANNIRTFTVENELIIYLRNNKNIIKMYDLFNKTLFDETFEDLTIYKPKKNIVKIKKERPEQAYDRKILEKQKNTENAENTENIKEQKDLIKYTIKDIKSTLKVAELKIIAENLNISIKNKTRDELLRTIKEYLSNN
jgi:hypothetical protein